jgi:hypothetical protein
MTRFELDTQNRGNPTIGVLMAARRLLTRGARRLIAANPETSDALRTPMTLLTHYHDLSRHPVRRNRKADRREIRSSASREAAMRGFFRAAVTIMLATMVLAGIIALKTAIYLPHFNY